jgi:hypothetical protein
MLIPANPRLLLTVPLRNVAPVAEYPEPKHELGLAAPAACGPARYQAKLPAGAVGGVVVG